MLHGKAHTCHHVQRVEWRRHEHVERHKHNVGHEHQDQAPRYQQVCPVAIRGQQMYALLPTYRCGNHSIPSWIRSHSGLAAQRTQTTQSTDAKMYSANPYDSLLGFRRAFTSALALAASASAFSTGLDSIDTASALWLRESNVRACGGLQPRSPPPRISSVHYDFVPAGPPPGARQAAWSRGLHLLRHRCAPEGCLHYCRDRRVRCVSRRAADPGWFVMRLEARLLTRQDTYLSCPRHTSARFPS